MQKERPGCLQNSKCNSAQNVRNANRRLGVS
jgi:hypothetical protein